MLHCSKITVEQRSGPTGRVDERVLFRSSSTSNDIADSDYHPTGKLALFQPTKEIKISAPFHLDPSADKYIPL